MQKIYRLAIIYTQTDITLSSNVLFLLAINSINIVKLNKA